MRRRGRPGAACAAQSTAWLFVARAVQGLALGTTVGTAAAALVELEPDGDPSRAALGAVLGQSGGSAAGRWWRARWRNGRPRRGQLCYTAKLLTTTDLALLGAITAVMLAMACVAQAIALRGATTSGRAQPLGLVLIVGGIAALVLAFPLHSLALVLVAAVLAGTGWASATTARRPRSIAWRRPSAAARSPRPSSPACTPAWSSRRSRPG